MPPGTAEVIFLLSLIYITILGAIGFNYMVSVIFRINGKGNLVIKSLGVLSLVALIYVVGAIPFTLIGSYVMAATQTRNQLKKTE